MKKFFGLMSVGLVAFASNGLAAEKLSAFVSDYGVQVGYVNESDLPKGFAITKDSKTQEFAVVVGENFSGIGMGYVARENTREANLLPLNSTEKEMLSRLDTLSRAF